MVKSGGDEVRLSRRGWLALVPGGLAAVGLVGGAGALALPPPPRDPGRLRRVGLVAEMDVGAGQAIDDGRVLVVRSHAGVHAISLICTHLGCAVTHHQRGFECHCHGSTFDPEGRPLTGPADRPLPWLAVTLHEGWVLVDLDQEVDTGTVTAV